MRGTPPARDYQGVIRLTRAHKAIIGLALLAITSTSLYPPWRLRGGMAAGYFLLSNHAPHRRIDYQALELEWLVIVLTAGAITLLLPFLTRRVIIIAASLFGIATVGWYWLSRPATHTARIEDIVSVDPK